MGMHGRCAHVAGGCLLVLRQTTKPITEGKMAVRDGAVPDVVSTFLRGVEMGGWLRLRGVF